MHDTANTVIVGTLHIFTKRIQRQQQRLTPLLRSLIKIIMKSTEDEPKTPEAHFSRYSQAVLDLGMG